MDRTEQFHQKLRSYPDNDLVEKVDQLITDLCENTDRAFTMSVPPMVTDSDMLLFELLRRYKECLSREGAAKDYIHFDRNGETMTSEDV